MFSCWLILILKLQFISILGLKLRTDTHRQKYGICILYFLYQRSLITARIQRTSWRYPSPSQRVPQLAGTGVPPPPRQNSRACTYYAVGGTPLVVTQEDFLVGWYLKWALILKTRMYLCTMSIELDTIDNIDIRGYLTRYQKNSSNKILSPVKLNLGNCEVSI